MATQRGDVTRIGRFELLDILGGGGFATVYLAHDEALDRDVALKLLHPHLATDPYTVRRFQTEARAAAGLRHPNIVTVYEVGRTADGLPYLVMELLEGVTLSGLLADRGRLTLAEASAILSQLAGALEYMHRRGVVHRDLKPSNVLIAADGHVTLLDFGSARELDQQTRRTLTGELLGTFSYMAPEQITGQTISPATDVYALGLLYFAMLTGTVPFDGPPAAVLHQQVYRPAPSLRKYLPDVPASVERAVASALSKTPSQRPPSAEAFARRLLAPAGEPRSALYQHLHRRTPAITPERHTAPPTVTRSGEPPERASVTGAVASNRHWPAALAWLSAGGLMAVLLLVVWLGLSATIAARPQRVVSSLAPTPDATATPRSVNPAAGSASPLPLAGAPPTAPPYASPAASPIAAREVTEPAASPPGQSALESGVAPCANIAGPWVFTDDIESGAGAGQSFTFLVYLSQEGSVVTGTGQLSLSGALRGCELAATFSEPGGTGSFDWVFSPDGSQLNGSFVAPSFGNAGRSIGQRRSS